MGYVIVHFRVFIYFSKPYQLVQDFFHRQYLGGALKHVLLFTPIPGEMIQFDLRMFFKWVGKKKHQLDDYIPER